MQPSEKDLSKYRLERAEEDIRTARINLENGLYKGAINRAYYAIFHAIRAVNALDGFDAIIHRLFTSRHVFCLEVIHSYFCFFTTGIHTSYCAFCGSGFR